MIDTKELRRLSQAAISRMSARDPEFASSVTPLAVLELLDRLEAAEKERDVLRDRLALESQENGALRDSVDRACEERDALRAKIARMERQEPVMWANSSTINSSRINKERGGRGDQHTCSETQTAYHDTQLYALPGAKGE